MKGKGVESEGIGSKEMKKLQISPLPLLPCPLLFVPLPILTRNLDQAQNKERSRTKSTDREH
jgi:hypothetical protein